MKRAASIVLAVLLLLLAVPMPAAGENAPLYKVQLDAPPSAAVGESVQVFLYIEPINTSDNSGFNSYYFALAYDNDRLEFNNAVFGASNNSPESAPVVAEAANGKLIIAGYGETLTTNYMKLSFTLISDGDATVTLTRANIDRSDNAQNDARTATILNSSVTVHAGGYPVTLPEKVDGITDVSGPAFAAAGGNYTFTALPAGMAFEFTATVDDGVDSLNVIDNKDGTYTVFGVTGDLEIKLLNANPRTYSVELQGNGKDDVVGFSGTATYNEPYEFSINTVSGYHYAVSVTVGGQTVAPEVDDNSYTIPGTAIEGDIVITVTKAIQADTTQIMFVGNGTDDLENRGGVYTAVNGQSFAFKLNKKTGYEYTVTAEKNGATIPVTGDDSGTYIIAGENINGGIITVTVTRSAPPAVDVTAQEFLTCNGSTIFLLRATAREDLGESRDLMYGDKHMLWSSEYKAYVWLVKVATDTANEVVEEAKTNISISNKAEHITVLHTGNVNSSKQVDINDAQLIYDLCMKNTPIDITQNGNMQALLNGDVNCNGKLDTGDARAVVFRIK